MLERIRIVMVSTSHAGNIGSAARAMKTMGLTQLWLVNPSGFPGPKADAMAAGATDLLASAHVVASVDEAITGCGLVLGASARQRRIPWPHLHAGKGAAMALAQAVNTDIAILFGREQSGLSNDELQRCHAHVEIPGNPEYPVLNVASAIQVICYELRKQWLEAQQTVAMNAPLMPVELVRWDDVPASADRLEKFFVHCEQALLEIGFFEADTPKKLMARVRRLFLRARPDERELRMLRGMLSSAQEAARNGKLTQPRVGGKE
jgi:tRNA (cytidine32/uridine32-2'-O)-methyltransferase